ncbi:MAG: squalene synthase HpnC [Chlamydiae bacterium]|nr:squalene synthase HpnC [Chlamydiota bacterium]MBI3276645.1 squalene synthase HpnC [Chlamydiota bacterium]
MNPSPIFLNTSLGVDDSHKTFSLDEAFQYCEKMARSHYENFTVGSYLIPKKMRPHLYAIYAFCRWSDDLGDEISDSQKSFELLDLWSQELRTCLGGKPQHPVMIALQETMTQHHLPIEPFQDLIKAFKMDQVVHRYKNLEELLYYCRYSANPVGRIFLMLFGYRDEERFALSDATCTALQLANFWQDVAVDLSKGRIYIPLEDMYHFSYSEKECLEKKFNPSFVELMKFEIERTRKLFSQGLPLVTKIKGRLQLDIELFSRGGLEILKGIEKNNYNVFQNRPVLSKHHKIRLGMSTTLHFLKRNFFVTI